VGFKAADGRLRGQRTAALWTAPNRKPQAISDTRAITISNISCRMRLGSRRSVMVFASRQHTPSVRGGRQMHIAIRRTHQFAT
jgi:hypothetical protein